MEVATKNNITNIIKGVGISLGFTLIFLTIYSAILTYTNVSEQWTSPVIIIISAISILIGSSISNLKIKKNGILNGATIGGIYLTTIYFISSIITKNFAINIQTIITIATGMAFGIIGGIIGVNKKIK